MIPQTSVQIAQKLWGKLPKLAVNTLLDLTKRYSIRIESGDLLYLRGSWYITHSGLLRIAEQKRCSGISVVPFHPFCDPGRSRWVFKAIVYKCQACKGFVAFGDANPFNVSPVVRGAEMRVAETRAVNRALRKAYGVGICSVEELGYSTPVSPLVSSRKISSTPDNGNARSSGPKLRDRLCQLIRQHRLDANLVKSYAVDFCGTETLREATREQIEAFVAHLSDWAEKDCNALLCQLNSYLPLQIESQRKREIKKQSETESETQKEKAGAA